LPRPTCPRCRRPTPFCFCARIPSVDNRTPVVVVQHTKERSHPHGTLRIASLGLTNLSVLEAHPEVPPTVLPARCALLFPGDTSSALETLPPAERPGALMLVDGTWSQARKIVRLNPWIAALPRVRLDPSAPSNYRIRREPRPNYISTIESLVAALEILEPDTEGLRGLLDAFDGMVDDVLAHIAALGRSPRRRGSVRERRTHLTPIRDSWDRLVVIHGEGIRVAEDPTVRRVLVWGATRVAESARFFRMVRHQQPLGDTRLGHMRLTEAQFAEHGEEEAAVARSWRDWSRADDVYLAWSTQAFELVARLAGRPIVGLEPLKQLVNRGVGETPGSLTDVARALDVEVPPATHPGRIGEWIATMEALAAVLAARAVAKDESLRSRPLPPRP